MKVKICGMRRAEDIEFANRVKPDRVGFILTERFRRYVPPERVTALREALDPSIQVVGVFVDEPVDYVVECVRMGAIDCVQLHGNEDDAYILSIKKQIDCPVVKALVVKGADDVEYAERCPADEVLLDGGTGEGRAFNWTLLKGMKRPYHLAGGLSPENVAEAVRALDPYGVDVSSGVETDGVKDEAKMRAFTEAARNTND